MKIDKEYLYFYLDMDINVFNYICIECGIMFWVIIVFVVECLVFVFYFLYNFI